MGVGVTVGGRCWASRCGVGVGSRCRCWRHGLHTKGSHGLGTVIGEPVLKKPMIALRELPVAAFASNRKLYNVPQRIALAFWILRKRFRTPSRRGRED